MPESRQRTRVTPSLAASTVRRQLQASSARRAPGAGSSTPAAASASASALDQPSGAPPTSTSCTNPHQMTCSAPGSTAPARGASAGRPASGAQAARSAPLPTASACSCRRATGVSRWSAGRARSTRSSARATAAACAQSGAASSSEPARPPSQVATCRVCSSAWATASPSCGSASGGPNQALMRCSSVGPCASSRAAASAASSCTASCQAGLQTAGMCVSASSRRRFVTPGSGPPGRSSSSAARNGSCGP
ncbi:MAG: hypothetical protein QM767_24805 [Anaeromyxobacter sp.]